MLGIVGAVTPPGRLVRATADLLDRARTRHPGTTTELVNLADRRISFADGRPADQFDDDTGPTVRSATDAEAVVLASPVYRGSLSGSLKNLIDQLPLESLMGKPVGILVVGATLHHFLGVDRHLRDILTWYGALVPATSVYLASADFADGAPTEAATADLDALADALLALKGLPPEAMGPRPLAARKGGG
jgi:FMN reductase